ncbi:MAG: glycosyltransferase family 4 protein [Bacteroidales bacterium]|nr:glycosyltransferase family 4 protein [Bacteroidales bacterium]
MEREIIAWFDHPPKVEKGPFNVLSRLWPAKVWYVILKPLREDRKAASWDEDSDFGKAEVVRLYEKPDADAAIAEFCREHPDAIHIGNGFDTPVMLKAKKYIFEGGNPFLMFSERPAPLGGSLPFRLGLAIYHWLKYTRLRFEYSRHVNAFLPLGERGVRAYRRCGWRRDKLFRYMYCPPVMPLAKETAHPGKPVRFVCLGRFYYKTKGTDVLLDALKYLRGDFTLDFAGGYGPDETDLRRRIEPYANVRCVGVWKSQEVLEKLSDYDVAVVPSRADGWNLVVNEAMDAGIGVIASDQAVSDEMVPGAGNGLVFRSERPRELAAAMQKVIDDPSLAKEWAARSREFAPSVSQEVVGRYLRDIVLYVLNPDGPRPACPWKAR